MSVGRELKRIRIANKLSAAKFAKHVGIDADRLRKWEVDLGSPKDEDESIIEGYFGVPIDELSNIDKFQFSSKKVPRGTKKSDEIAVLQAQVKELTRALAQLNETVTKKPALDFYLEIEKRMRVAITEQLNGGI